MLRKQGIINSTYKTGSRGRGKVFLEEDQWVRSQLRDDNSLVENNGSRNRIVGI